MGRIGPTEIIILFMLLAFVGVIAAVVVVARRTGPDPLAATMPSGRWAADPTRRHELRWWDGAQWTSSVSDAGVLGHDPL